MMHEVAIQLDQDWADFEPTLIRAAITTLEKESAEPGSSTLVLTDAGTIRNLNRKYAGDDYPTDVLSFVDGTPDPDTGKPYYGDVIIAVDIAQDQAEKSGHSLIVELTLLTVHGVLHLLGHDHGNEQQKHEMWSLQEEILLELGVELGKGYNNR
jgi:probable rRNA maturation factor